MVIRNNVVSVRVREVCECNGKGKGIIFAHGNSESDQRLKFLLSLSLYLIPLYNSIF